VDNVDNRYYSVFGPTRGLSNEDYLHIRGNQR
jgi:hypothetical protein